MLMDELTGKYDVAVVSSLNVHRMKTCNQYQPSDLPNWLRYSLKNKQSNVVDSLQ
jgi:hypothetical protein